jgi:RimJ/RimL family protein N-acetyltransferase
MEYFRTTRLTAEKLHERHLADLISLHLDPDVSRYLGGVRPPDTTKAYLKANMAHWDRYGFGLWVLKTNAGEFAGRAGIRHIVVDDVDEIEVAYAFKRTLWGQGLASEITNTLTNIGLSEFELPSLVSLVSIENKASCRVLEKSSFALERTTMYLDEECFFYRSPAAFKVPERLPRPENG